MLEERSAAPASMLAIKGKWFYSTAVFFQSECFFPFVRCSGISKGSLPYLDAIEDDYVDLVLISHFHLDHCGALPVLPRLDRFEMVMCRAQFLPQWKGWKEENPNLYDVPNARHHEELAERLLVPLLE